MPESLWDHLGHVMWQVKQNREAEIGDHPLLQSHADLEGVPDDATSMCPFEVLKRNIRR